MDKGKSLMKAREKFKKDYERYYREKIKFYKVICRLFISRNLRFMLWLRLAPKTHLIIIKTDMDLRFLQQ